VSSGAGRYALVEVEVPDVLEIAPMLRELPKHLQTKTAPVYLWLLRRWANGLRGHYGVPVYLCGSALNPENPSPRDWDVRLRLPDGQWPVRFGGTAAEWIEQGSSGDWGPVRWRWSDECVKKTKEGWKATHLNIDFQLYPASYWTRFKDERRVRLDTK
jgi:hypothetical protein